MLRLKDRNRQIPNGFRFKQPETGWQPPRFASFETIVQGLMTHRKGNNALVQKHGWPTDRDSVANEVDAFNARICQMMGWKEFITSGEGADLSPFQAPPQSQFANLRNVVAGANLLVEWISEGADAVPPQLANARAEICCGKDDASKCPLNEQGDWTSFFTVPVSNAIRRELNRRREMKLETPHDARLGICQGCACPMKLKVHVPIEAIAKRLPNQVRDALDPRCWILSEIKEKAL